jgi:predicted GIY-YIG superfamily endonuclease
MRGKAPEAGTVVYLIHFQEPYRHARRYTGWTTDLDARLAEHRAGRCARPAAPGRRAGRDRLEARADVGRVPAA